MKDHHKALILKFFYSICILLLLGSNAQANFIELYDPNVPPSEEQYNITKDTQTGLEWLDIWSSNSISYNELTSELGIGGTLEGFRLATQEQLEVFFGNAGLTTGDKNDYSNLAEFMRLVGYNYEGPFFTSIWGIYDSGLVPADTNYATAQVEIWHPYREYTSHGGESYGDEGYGRGRVNFFPISYSESLGSLGTQLTYWLVRDADLPAPSDLLATPEPTTFALLSIGLAGLGGMVRRRRKDQA